MQKKIDNYSEQNNLNFVLTTYNDTNIETEFKKQDAAIFGKIKDVTNKDKYLEGITLPIDDLKEAIVASDTAYEGTVSFVDYVEGIYVGYKYYETASDDGVINYEDVVKYPFGYGLSYTTFEQKMNDFSDNGDNVTFNVTVTNTGDVAGKDVVEVYFTPPYTNLSLIHI